MEDKQIIELLLKCMKRDELNFTTKLDNIYEEPDRYFELDEYGDLTEKEQKRVVKEIKDIIGDGASDINEAVEVYVQRCNRDNRIAYFWDRKVHFKQKEEPIVPGLEASEINMNATHTDGVLNTVLNENNSLTEKRVNMRLRVGDKFINKNGVTVTIIDVDDNEQVCYRFDDGKTFCSNMKNAVNMLVNNTYEKVEESKLQEAEEDADVDIKEEPEDVEVKEEIVSKDPEEGEPTDKEEPKQMSMDDKISKRAQSLFNKLTDAGYKVDIDNDNGETQLSVDVKNGNILVTVIDDVSKLTPVTSGSIVLDDKNQEEIQNIKSIILNEHKVTNGFGRKIIESKKLEESELTDMLAELPDNSEPNIDTIDKDVTGVVDGILVITDPDMNSEEYDEMIERANDIVEGTPEGKIPTIEDYIGQFIQICPICGKTFVTKVLLGEGDSCPLCLDTPTNFVTVGKVETEEEEVDRETEEDEGQEGDPELEEITNSEPEESTPEEEQNQE